MYRSLFPNSTSPKQGLKAYWKLSRPHAHEHYFDYHQIQASNDFFRQRKNLITGTVSEILLTELVDLENLDTENIGKLNPEKYVQLNGYKLGAGPKTPVATQSVEETEEELIKIIRNSILETLLFHGKKIKTGPSSSSKCNNLPVEKIVKDEDDGLVLNYAELTTEEKVRLCMGNLETIRISSPVLVASGSRSVGVGFGKCQCDGKSKSKGKDKQ